MVSWKPFVLLSLLLLSFVGEYPIFVSAANEPSPGLATSLAITVTPAKLPADGGQYSAVVVSLTDKGKQPSIATEDTTVYLSSSQSNIGTLPAQITVEAGHVYAIADFSTTTTPGQTQITASSPGYQSASAAVETVTPSGFPSHIKVFVTPDTVLARPAKGTNNAGTVTVELTDDTFLPAKAVGDTTVQLSSSIVEVASLGSTSITVPSGQIFATGVFETSYIPGTAVITASASGFTSGSGSVSVVGPAPLQLRILPLPDSLPLSSSGKLVVSLTDQTGNPARAPRPVLISLTSSNLTVSTIPDTATIQPGQIYTVLTYASTSTKGSATLTATSPGLKSSTAVVMTAPPGLPVALKVLPGPSPVLSDSQIYSAIVVGLVDSKDNPAIAGSSISVHLTSSSATIGSVPGLVTIPVGSSFISANFTSTFASGTTIVTASAPNLLPDQQSISSFGPVASAITLEGVPKVLPADGQTYAALSISLSDSSGAPVIAPVDTNVELSSSKSDIVSVNSVITITAGTTSKITNLRTSVLAGAANITASSVGLGSASLPFQTVIPAPSKLAIFVGPATTISSSVTNWPQLVLQLQDSHGNPARAREDTLVVVTSSNGQLLNHSIKLTIRPGSDYFSILLVPDGTGTGVLTATSGGLGPASADLQVLPFPATVSVSSIPPFIYANQTATFSADVSFLGAPLRNATYAWVTQGGLMVPVNGTTNSEGKISGTFLPNRPGNDNITLILHAPSIGQLVKKTYLSVLQVPPKPSQTILQILLTYWYFIVAAAAAVVVAVVMLLRMRRRKAKAELEAGFEAVS